MVEEIFNKTLKLIRFFSVLFKKSIFIKIYIFIAGPNNFRHKKEIESNSK